MARHTRCRKVCCLPKAAAFVPSGGDTAEAVILTIEEYETLRLIDREGFSQEECGRYMDVARTTAQQIYASARRKVADALVEGRTLKIEGGAYRLCDGMEAHCGCGGCRKHRMNLKKQEEGHMKIVIPVDEDRVGVCPVFARAPLFMVCGESADEAEFLVNPAAAEAGGAGIKAAQFLVDLGADTLITLRLGENSAEILQEAGVKIYHAESSEAKANVEALCSGNLPELTKFHAGFQGIQ